MSSRFRLSTLPSSRLIDVDRLWPIIDFEPTYQRQSDIWSLGKRQLFIDSLINGLDIPKLYFHDVSWNAESQSKRYAIIDGKQRLEAIHAFVAGRIRLSDEFEDLQESTGVGGADLGYSALARQFPTLKTRLDEADLPIVVVQTEDYELIDEMFSRLNEAVPLNAPEKRNALGGPLPRHIRNLVQTEFFASRMAFANSRYRHLDLATKFLYIEYRGGLTDLKKRDLDEFVKDFKGYHRTAQADRIYASSVATLKHMSAVFLASDPLLRSVGTITVYYALVREAAAGGWLQEVTRDALERIDYERERNRALVREAQERALAGKPALSSGKINPVLTQFERYVQSPNDARALKYRLDVLRHFVATGRVAAG